MLIRAVARAVPAAAAAAGTCSSSRHVSSSSSRHFLQTILSTRITNREREKEEQRQRRETERLLLATRLAEADSSSGSLSSRSSSLLSLDDAQLADELRQKKQEFHEAIFIYLQRYGRTRRGHAEFIEAAARRLQEFGLSHDLEAYRALMQLFPKERMRVKSMWQSEFKHYPKQQDAALYLMDVMMDNGVMPDTEFGLLICQTFGTESYVMSKYQRMMYWMPKLRHADPWPAGAELTHSAGLRLSARPKSSRDLAAQALRRFCPDPLTTVTTFDIQLQQQEQGLQQLQPGIDAVYLDGPFSLWLHTYHLHYYVLCSEASELAQRPGSPPGASSSKSASSPEIDPRDEEDYSWWADITFPFDSAGSKRSQRQQQRQQQQQQQQRQRQLQRALTVHEQSDMTILAAAVASHNSRQLLLHWVRLLADHSCSHLHQLQLVSRITNLPQYQPAVMHHHNHSTHQ